MKTANHIEMRGCSARRARGDGAGYVTASSDGSAIAPHFDRREGVLRPVQRGHRGEPSRPAVRPSRGGGPTAPSYTRQGRRERRSGPASGFAPRNHSGFRDRLLAERGGTMFSPFLFRKPRAHTAMVPPHIDKAPASRVPAFCQADEAGHYRQSAIILPMRSTAVPVLNRDRFFFSGATITLNSGKNFAQGTHGNRGEMFYADHRLVPPVAPLY